MRFHVLGLSHTKTSRDYSACAFTQKIRLLSKMMTDLGHTVYHYGVAGSDPICTENVEVVSLDTFNSVHNYDYKRDGFNLGHDNEAFREHGRRAVEEIGKRAEDGDFLLCPFGVDDQQIAEAFPRLISVESGIGYEKTFARWRVFESYAWMHFHYGREGRALNPSWYDAVIPNYLDPKDYPFNPNKGDYAIFLGRPTHLKGGEVAQRVCDEVGVHLFTAGQGGDPSDPMHLGVLSIEDRAKWVGGAMALFAPTSYIEPFGTVAIEAMAYGTPVITSDFGAFTETVKHGRTGFRCRTYEQFVWALKNIGSIKPSACRKHALKTYGIERVGKMYEEYFSSLKTLYKDPEGWYAANPERTQLDWLRS